MMAGESQHQVPVELTWPVGNPHLGEGLFEHRRVSHLIPSPGGHQHASPHQPGQRTEVLVLALPCDLKQALPYDCSLHLHEQVEAGHVFASSGELPSILGEPV